MSSVLIVPNEPLPRPGRISSGPGLRALNLAAGLHANGHDIIVAVPALAQRKPNDSRPLGPPMLREVEEVPIDLGSLKDFIASRQPNVVIFTNYHTMHNVSKKNDNTLTRIKFIYDFFAPRILEQAAAGQLPGTRLNEEQQKKSRALTSADGILVNGERKLGYVAAWLAISGANLRTPIVQAPFCVPVQLESLERAPKRSVSDLRVVVSGNRQPWTRSRLNILDILPATSSLGWSLTHIGNPKITLLQEAGATYLPWIHDGLIDSHSDLDFPTFLQLLLQADLALDIFETSLEREMSYPTRSAVALSAGIPVIHPAETEISDLIRKWGCGWIYHNEAEIFGILNWIRSETTDFLKKAEAARRLAKNFLNPRVTTVAAAQLISDISLAPSSRRKQVFRTHSGTFSQARDWMARLVAPEWFIRQFHIDRFDAARAASPVDLYMGYSDERGYPPPNYILAHWAQRNNVKGMQDISFEACMAILVKYIDVGWYAATYSIHPDIFSCAENYFSLSGKRRISPSPFFCETLYINLNGDVRDAIANGVFINGFHHYLVSGMRDRRPATILFDDDYYLEANKDVAAEVGRGNYNSGFEHFLEYGNYEDRTASPLFDWGYYKAAYRDLPTDWGPPQLLRHFAEYGFKEQRFGSKFHRDLLVKKLQPPPLQAYAKRTRTALEELGRNHSGAADLMRRFDRHVDKIYTSFVAELTTSIHWLSRIHAYAY